MLNEITTTPELQEPELIRLINSAPSVKALRLDFNLKRENTSDIGYFFISDFESDKVKITQLSPSEHWSYGLDPRELFINIEKQKNTGFVSNYVDGALKRGYELRKGRLIFWHGGNTSNPDALIWEDSFATIEARKIELQIGSEIPQREKDELKRWLRNYN